MEATAVPGHSVSDRYVLERELGHGGMGVVWLARDTRHERRVALKFIAIEPPSEAGSLRFLDEIRTAARLNHPHILPVHDSGTDRIGPFYVMPYVAGESLRDRIDRLGRLPVAESLGIARQLGDALAHAHARGVVHRDIKPENVLLDAQGHALLTDFGVARALTPELRPATSAGVRVGSPTYMSPEQVAGDRSVDGRSDLYSLGCVLFEMLAGEPPYAGDDLADVLRRHLSEPPPSIRALRADVPVAVERLLLSLLAKSPRDRIDSAASLVASLDDLGRSPAAAGGAGWLPRLLAVSATTWVMLAVAGALSLAAAVRTHVIDGLFGAEVHADRYAVLPLRWSGGPAGERAPDLALANAVQRWQDLDVVDRVRVADEVRSRGGPDALRGADALTVARRLGAGRYLHGMATPVADSVQLSVSLYDTGRPGSPLRTVALRVPAAGDIGAPLTLLADSLLFGRVTWYGGAAGDVGTSSAAARRAFGRAFDALDRWDLPAADSFFGTAVAIDPHFDRARAWLAQTRHRAGAPESAWGPLAASVSGNATLTPSEALLSRGLALLAERRYPESCAAYRDLLASGDSGFGAWFGLGECQRRDDRVVRDAASPTGWRFRASYDATIRAYRRALAASPGSFRAFSDDGYARLRDEILVTRPNLLQFGSDAAGRTFVAFLQWRDSLTFLPYPADSAHVGIRPDRGAEAVIRQRRVFSEIAHQWSVAYPDEADVANAVSLALELLGDPTALDTLQRARRLAPRGTVARRLAFREVWLRLKLGATRPADLTVARNLADSLLRSRPVGASPAELAGLAVLTGRPALGAGLARADPAGLVGPELPDVVAAPAAALLVFAAAGGPTDSLEALESETRAAIENAVPSDERPQTVGYMLERPSILAFPEHVSTLLRDGAMLGAPVSRAQAELLAGRVQAVGRYLDSRAPAPTDPPWNLTPDVVYADAALAHATGRDARAASILDPVLENLRWADPGMISDVGNVGALVRCMALRATIAAAQGDAAVARRWATAVLSLWSGGEPTVDATIERMNQLRHTD